MRRAVAHVAAAHVLLQLLLVAHALVVLADAVGVAERAARPPAEEPAEQLAPDRVVAAHTARQVCNGRTAWSFMS